MFEPTLLLVEFAGALSRRGVHSSTVAGLLEGVRALPDLSLAEVDDELIAHATRIAITRRMRGADAIYLALAEMRDVPLITWDRQQAEAAGARGFTPDDAP